MEQETPKSMRRYNRNIFHRMGKLLEENLHLSSPNLLPRSFSYSSQQSDTTSLQNYPTEQYVHQTTFKPAYDSSFQYDQEMQIVCSNLLRDNIKRITNRWDYDKKASLLRVATSYNNPKIFTPVLLYLEKSLTHTLFYDLIRQYPQVVYYYINLSKVHPDQNHYLNTLVQLKQHETLGMIHIRNAGKQTSLSTKLTALEHAASELQGNPWWCSLVNEYHYLLEKQREMQRYLASSQDNLPLENQTFLRTYKVVFGIAFQQTKYRQHQDQQIMQFVDDLEKNFSMTLEMMTCGRLAVIMKCSFRSFYDDFLQLTTYQGFFGRKCVIPPENFASMVYNWMRSSGESQEKASEEAGRFIVSITKPTRRVHFAEKYQNYDIAIDTIVSSLRDQTEMEKLVRKIPQEHPSYNRALYFYHNTNWRVQS